MKNNTTPQENKNKKEITDKQAISHKKIMPCIFWLLFRPWTVKMQKLQISTFQHNPNPAQTTNNLTFHNLCNKQQLPAGTRHLLRLNLHFCLTPKSLNENIRKAILKMAYSIRMRYHLKDTRASSEANYIPQIYLRNKNWNPLLAPASIEDQLTFFEKSLKKRTRLTDKKIW